MAFAADFVIAEGQENEAFRTFIKFERQVGKLLGHHLNDNREKQKGIKL